MRYYRKYQLVKHLTVKHPGCTIEVENFDYIDNRSICEADLESVMQEADEVLEYTKEIELVQ